MPQTKEADTRECTDCRGSGFHLQDVTTTADNMVRSRVILCLGCDGKRWVTVGKRNKDNE